MNRGDRGCRGLQRSFRAVDVLETQGYNMRVTRTGPSNESIAMKTGSELHRGIPAADVVLRAYLREFEVGTSELTKGSGELSVDTARRLCALSRDILFRLGPPGEESLSLLVYLLGLFHLAVSLMMRNDVSNPIIKVCLENIQQRAQDIEHAGLEACRIVGTPGKG